MAEQADQQQPGGMFRYRPRRIRQVAWAGAVVVVAAAAALAAALSGPIGEGRAVFGPADRVGLLGLGVIGAVALLLLTRPVVAAGPDGLRVRNLVGEQRLPWQLVRAIRFDHGASWAIVELVDDDLVGVLAVQAVDKQRAVAAVRQLRARHAAYGRRAGSPAPPATEPPQ